MLDTEALILCMSVISSKEVIRGRGGHKDGALIHRISVLQRRYTTERPLPTSSHITSHAKAPRADGREKEPQNGTYPADPVLDILTSSTMRHQCWLIHLNLCHSVMIAKGD